MTVLARGSGSAAPPGSVAAVSCEQVTYTFGTHTAVDHLDLRIEPGETFGQLFARLFDVPRKERAERVDGALAAMGLADAAHRRAATYSGGMLGHIRATGAPDELKASLGDHVSLDDIFRRCTGGTLHDDEEKGGIRNVRRARSTARRLG